MLTTRMVNGLMTFWHFGGVTHEVLVDNAKALVEDRTEALIRLAPVLTVASSVRMQGCSWPRQ